MALPDIYKKIVSGNYNYHCHAKVSIGLTLEKAVWAIWRENQVSGEVTYPVNTYNEPSDKYSFKASDATSLDYLEL